MLQGWKNKGFNEYVLMLSVHIAGAHTGARQEATFLLDLPFECAIDVLRLLSIVDVLAFSTCSVTSRALAGADEIWKVFFLSRVWIRPSALGVDGIAPGTWRDAYSWWLRAESPLVLQFDALRSLGGFANDMQPRPVVPSAPPRRHGQLCLPNLEAAIDDVLASLGFCGLMNTIGDVCFVAACGDAVEELSCLAEVCPWPLKPRPLLMTLIRPVSASPWQQLLFRRGAHRICFVDAAVAALHFGCGKQARASDLITRPQST
jgi:hypothetical protein